MLQILFFFTASLFVGLRILKLFRVVLSQSLQIPAAIVIGSVFLCLGLFGIGHVMWTSLVVWGVVVVSGGLAAAFSHQSLTSLRLPKFRKKTLLLIGFFVLLVVWLFSRALFVDAEGSLVAGDRLVWVDWPLHIGMAANFAWGNNFPPQNPTFAGSPLVYPFFADFLSGVLLKMGAALPIAFAGPGIVLVLCFFWLFVGFVREVFGESRLFKSLRSPNAFIFLPLFLSLFWGGLGWVYWLQEAFQSEVTLVSRLLTPIREYTFWGEKGFWFFTFLYSEILPQRAFLFGLPVFFLVLLLLRGKGKEERGKFLLAGILTGILPFFHTHALMSLLIVVGVYEGGRAVYQLVFQKSRTSLTSLVYFLVPAGILLGLQYPTFAAASQVITPKFGWLAEQENFFWFWFKNTGLFWPLWIVGWWKGGFSRAARWFGVASVVLFIIPNLFQFAPWAYDNLKIFTFWYLIGSLFVAAGLIWIGSKGWLGRMMMGLLIVSLTLSGMVEVSRIVNTEKVKITLWHKADQLLAAEVKAKTEPQAVFLAAAIHDHPIETLAGRKLVIGFPGNMWSWGMKGWDEREKDVHTMYQGGPLAVNLWKKYDIVYIIVSDRERYFEPRLNEDFIAQKSQLVIEQGNARVYKVKSLIEN